MRGTKLVCGAALALALVLAGPAAGQAAAVDDGVTPGPRPATIEPGPFFAALADRYRALTTYEDVVEVVETRSRPGRPPLRVETRIACRLEGARLSVTTPGSQVRTGAGLDLPLETRPAMEALVLRYNLWLAPHMALHFVDDPLKDLRLGVPEGFTPAAAETVSINERDLVRLELRGVAASESDAAGETARFEFWVDPESMLIERVEGRQRLPDGANYRTTLQITPRHADGAT